ncbi:hypothetical protein RBJ15_09405 [Pantoea sp. BS_4]|uniref:hypothetical protein n=1 Tax=Pantoea TaxID=53335 RepID=UPI001561F688|nr:MULTISPECIES: hypothetical protein [Pantoea]WRH23016.1 hypothetical protein GC090_20350 [Pantoea sp. JZ29]
MQKNKSTDVVSCKDMHRLAVSHLQAYLKACHCQSRGDVLHALSHWQSTGADLAELIRLTRIIVIH